jgi:hypothetical protein
VVARSGLFVAPTSGVGTAPTDARLALAGLIGVAPQTVQGGAITQSSSNMQFTIAPAVLQLPDPTNAAATFLSPIDQTILTPAVGPTTGSRVDLIVGKQNNPENGDADSRANFSIVAGTAGAPGLPPAVPAGFSQLAQIQVPTNAATASACTVTVKSPSVFAPPALLATTWALLQTVTGQLGQTATVYADANAANNQTYRWLPGTGWVSAAGGLVMVKPSSVANTGGSASISALGAVTVTGASVLSLNGLFSTVYDNYRVVADVTFSAVSLLAALFRAGGTDNLAAAYSYQGLQGQGSATAAGASTNGTNSSFTNASGLTADATIDIFSPALAQNTRHNSLHFITNGATMVTGSIAGVHAVASAFDGLTLKTTAGTMTGTIRVYGYNNG